MRFQMLSAVAFVTSLATALPAGAPPAALFIASPADPALVAAVIPRGNINPGGGHIRPVKHMYLEYLTPRNGGTDSVEIRAMAAGSTAMVYHRQETACLRPVGPDRRECSPEPGSTALIDEYGIWIYHRGNVTSYYDHLHELDPGLVIPDWRDPDAGWVTLGSIHVLFFGLNGAPPPSRVRPGEPLGISRNYFHAWDIGVVDTSVVNGFLGFGPLRYPSLSELVNQFIAEGGDAARLGPDEPFPGEAFVNSACFIDGMTKPLAAVWAAKLRGDGSCGRPDWDIDRTLHGNWYRSDVTTPTLANMRAIEDNSISFSPYNLDPATQIQIAIGENYFAGLPPSSDATELRIRERLSRGLRLTPDRTPGALHNPDPANIGVLGYGCYDIPDGPDLRSLLVYHQDTGGGRLRLLHDASPCPALLATVTPANLPGFPWLGTYDR